MNTDSSENKNICQCDLGRTKVIAVFSSALDAAKNLFPHIQFASNHISNALRNQCSTAYGYVWCYQSQLNNINTDIKYSTHISVKRRLELEQGDQKYCGRCHTLVSPNNFTNYHGSLMCLPCLDTYIKSMPKEHFFREMLSHAKKSSGERLSRNRVNAGVFSLTLDDIVDLWNKQEGKCYYSKIKMSYLPNSIWQVSIERLNTNQGYTKENVVLSTLEFNGRVQWSIDKINNIPNEINKQVDCITLIDRLNSEVLVKSNRPKGRYNKKVNKIIRNNITYKICPKCDTEKEEKEFCKKRTECLKCHAKYYAEYSKSLKAFISKLVSSAKSHSKQREKREKRKISSKRIKRSQDESFITVEEICSQLIKQNFRCSYSNIPLHFAPHSQYQASIERVNPNKDYVKNNIVIICLEFNTGCNRGTRDYIIEEEKKEEFEVTDSQWNKDKFDFFYEILSHNMQIL